MLCECGKSFKKDPVFYWKKYCSPACRKRFKVYRWRVKNPDYYKRKPRPKPKT